MRALREHRTFVQARDLDVESAHERSYRARQRRPNASWQCRATGLRRLLGLGVRHARDRLIDKQQFRILRQQHADLEPLFLTMAEIAGETARDRSSRRTRSSISSISLIRYPVALAEQRRPRRRARPPARGGCCPRPCGFRRPSASGICGQCRDWRSRPRPAWSDRGAIEDRLRP